RLPGRDLLLLPSELPAQIQLRPANLSEQSSAARGDAWRYAAADSPTFRPIEISACDGGAIAARGDAGAGQCRIHLSNGPRSRSDRAGRVPEMRDGFGTGDSGGADDKDGICLSDASGDSAGRAGVLSDLRNGAGTACHHFGRRREPRIERYE